MKIDKVILSTNDNPMYYPFWNIVSKYWSKIINIEPVLFYVGDVSPKALGLKEEHGKIIHYDTKDKTKSVKTSNLSQIIRHFGATCFPEETCLTSDIDMLPLSKDYFINQKEMLNFEENSICFYSGDWGSRKRFPMCYIAAKGRTFEEIIKSKYEDFESESVKWMSEGHGWHTDEIVFSRLWKESRFAKTSLFLSRGWSHGQANNRIDRDSIHKFDINKMPNYIDFHMMRPMLRNKEILLKIEDHYEF